MIDNIKIAFLFIGAMIGAGFASGSELMVFFGDDGIAGVLLAAALIGVLVFVFANASIAFKRFKFLKLILDITITISSIITLITMTAGANEVIESGFNIRYFGVISSILAGISCIFTMRFMKNANALIVPLIVGLLIYMICVTDISPISGGVNFGHSLSYAGMNVMLGGYLMSEECKDKQIKDKAIISLIIALIIAIMMLIVYLVAEEAKYSSMPIYEVALRYGMVKISAVVIYLAILSTIFSAAKVVFDNIAAFMRDKFTPLICLISLSVLSAGAVFEYMVRTFYPITAYISIINITLVLIALFITNFPLKKNAHKRFKERIKPIKILNK